MSEEYDDITLEILRGIEAYDSEDDYDVVPGQGYLKSKNKKYNIQTGTFEHADPNKSWLDSLGEGFDMVKDAAFSKAPVPEVIHSATNVVKDTVKAGVSAGTSVVRSLTELGGVGFVQLGLLDEQDFIEQNEKYKATHENLKANLLKYDNETYGNITEVLGQYIVPGVGIYKMFDNIVKIPGIKGAILRGLGAESTLVTAVAPSDEGNFATFLKDTFDINEETSGQIFGGIVEYVGTVSNDPTAAGVAEQKLKNIIGDSPLGVLAEVLVPTIRLIAKAKNKGDALENQGDGFTQGDVPPAGSSVTDDQKEVLKNEINKPTFNIENIKKNETYNRLIDETRSGKPTVDDPNYGKPEFLDNREYIVNGVSYKGFANGGAKFYENSKKIAYENLGRTYDESLLKQEKKATILLGLPASGKSTFADNIAIDNGAVIIDVDEAKKILPENQDGLHASMVHEESTDFSEQAYQMAKKDRQNIVLPKTGKDFKKIEELIKDLKTSGYDVDLIYIDVSVANANRRMLSRFVDTGKLIPPEVIQQAENSINVYNKLKNSKGVNSYAKINNNSNVQGQKPITEQSENFVSGTNLTTRLRGQPEVQTKEKNVDGLSETERSAIRSQQANTLYDAILKLKEDEGFSITLDGKTPEELGYSKGFMVAPLKTTEIVFDSKTFDVEDAEKLLDNVEKLTESLEGRYDEVYAGAWFNPDDQKFYLDASVRIDNQEDALYIAKQGQQISIFNLENYETIGTEDAIKQLKESGTYSVTKDLQQGRETKGINQRFTGTGVDFEGEVN